MEGKEGNPNNEVSLDDDLETFRQTDKVTDSWVTLTALLKVGKPPNSLFLDTIEFLNNGTWCYCACTYQWGATMGESEIATAAIIVVDDDDDADHDLSLPYQCHLPCLPLRN